MSRIAYLPKRTGCVKKVRVLNFLGEWEKNDNALERCFEHIRKQHEAARFLQLAATFSQREARCPLLEDEDGELKLMVRGVRA